MDQVGAKAKRAEVQPVCVRRASFAALPEIPAIDGTIPRVRTDMNFKGLQDPYSECHQVLTSSLNAASIDTMLSGGLKNFFEKYNRLAETTNLQLQTPEIRFSNLSFSAQSSANSLSSGTVGSYLRQLFFPFCCKPPSVEKNVLHPMSGAIPPGSMTLLLASPGSGKTSFLKALANKLPTKHTKIGGSVSYSGLTCDQIDLRKLVGLVDQRDNHIATMTVRETLKFADLCLNGRPKKRTGSQSPTKAEEKMADVANLRTDLYLHILGLSNCADTIVGDDMLRGVSGGERKRVTVGEMLVGGQSIFLCDEISTGLDSAATFDIVNALKTWTKSLGGSCIVALLQPPPEVVELFDDILMLSDGHLVYHGPRTSTLPYFQSLGFVCPARTDPSIFMLEVVAGSGSKYFNPEHPTPAPTTSKAFGEAFAASPMHAAVRMWLKNSSLQYDVTSVKRLAFLARRTTQFSLAFWDSTKLLMARQVVFWVRDKELLYGKFIEACVEGLLLGIIYLNCDASLYLRMLFFTIAIFLRHAWQRITISLAVRNVFYKQRSRNFFRTSSYAIAEAVVQIPINLVVAIVLGSIFYFMSGLAHETSVYFTYLAVLVVFQHVIAAYFTLLSSIAPTITIAQSFAACSIVFFILFSGNIVLFDLIPTYWRWMYWCNPLTWALRAIMLNEYSSTRYSIDERADKLDMFEIRQDNEYIGYGLLVLFGYYLFFTTLNALALHFIRFDTQVRATSPPAAPPAGAATALTIETAPTQLPFYPACIAVRDLDYFVKMPSGDERQLLQHITASFEPGTMTALMGSSGAGKTTFMDVLAGRKTGGRIAGDIYINGEPKNPATFSCIASYCEQMDIHSEKATIREALEFSAFLRLPQTFEYDAKLSLVRETLTLLELDKIAHERVLNLSVEQKKRVTIGVEVVANPSILFLDEPTSGLDARSAQFVMRGVQSIARTGRTVICTIHQPSIQIFELFDSLLLLQKGGRIAFYGELGDDSQKLLEYFHSIPGTEKIQPLYNPATYMLEVIGAGVGRKDIKNYADVYASSDLCAANRVKVERLLAPSPDLVMFSTLAFQPIATSLLNQTRWLAHRAVLMYWRSPAYNFVRLVSYPVFAVIFGSTFYQLPFGTMAHVTSHIGLIYNIMDFIGVINMMTVLDMASTERPVFYRERMSNYYSPLPYTLSLLLAEIPYLVVVNLSFVAIVYWLVGWYHDAATFFFFWFIYFVYTSLCTFVGMWMAVLMPNIKVANVAVGATSCIVNLFGGFLLPFVRMKWGYKWLTWIIPSSYSLNVLVGLVVARCEDGVGPGCKTILVGGQPATVKSYVISKFGFDPAEIYSSSGALLLEWALIQVFIYLTLRFLCHLKR
ncbi:hypothetical protein SPRG_05753 [Saprolegnia parasitica CBS 223.65]|uniref:ABC transporter domain-containing protein n=1 Tax=Saprolegnia parasitica (strain CBS 223.65) TaxID=695850 RepID=A0A067CPY7_SAPPC|nr:hypothetical protein SPRG_05753 [Saprolegnia parasitica CBS 223.65]KDO28882.1 hypothetical protein SPRG_05753 [Saprolegnia parasitica CBS 223.65]|eukprot:XP_012200426.1 hypothetical protein SPRG_05753 [Saprolegnia parasitica CBS 223.65]